MLGLLDHLLLLQSILALLCGWFYVTETSSSCHRFLYSSNSCLLPILSIHQGLEKGRISYSFTSKFLWASSLTLWKPNMSQWILSYILPAMLVNVACDLELAKAWDDIFLVSVNMHIELVSMLLKCTSQHVSLDKLCSFQHVDSNSGLFLHQCWDRIIPVPLPSFLIFG